jgi:ribulose-5-phosphate 4-epimerase/fuculose-1-phosphate aldolase
MSTQAVAGNNAIDVRERVGEAEWRVRGGLAAAHRLLAHFGFVDLTYNHVSVRVPGAHDQFLLKADNLLFEQVNASNLVRYDLDGNITLENGFKSSMAAFNLHVSVLEARDDIMAVVHTHTPANLAVSAHRRGLLPISQQAMRFYNRIAYHKNAANDATREGSRDIADALGDKWTMLLENHGAVVCGATLAEAYIYHHFLELACRAQANAVGAGDELIIPPDEVCEQRAEVAGRHGVYDSDSRDWQASMLFAEHHFPDFKQ